MVGPVQPGWTWTTTGCSTWSCCAMSSGISTTSTAASIKKVIAPTAIRTRSTPFTPLVFHNDGKGHFTEVSKKIGLDKPAKALGISIADYDRDGHIDIFIANDSMPEFLFHNKGNGTFEETGLLSQVAVDEDGQTYAGMGTDFADYDNDGYPKDLFVDNLANQKYALYRNNRDGSFSYVSHPTGIAKATTLHSGWGVRFVDFDNDGVEGLVDRTGSRSGHN